MYSLILKDYRSHLRSSLRWLFDNDFSTVIIMFFVLGSDHKRPDAALAITIPYILCMALSRMYGGCMSKTLFLCPLDEQGRMEYMKKSIRLRIIISLLIYFVLNLIVIAFGGFSIKRFLLWLYFMICVSFSFNTYTRPKKVETRYATDKVYPVKGNYELWNFWTQFTATISIIAFAGYKGGELYAFEIVIGCILFVFQGICAIVMVKKFYKQVIEQAAFYE